MKLQIQAQMLRFRIDEAELAELLAGGQVSNSTLLSPGASFEVSVRLDASTAATLDVSAGVWRLGLPRDAVITHAGTLPCREGLTFQLPVDAGESRLTVVFEVDVRDSVRARGATRRAAKTPKRAT